MAVGAGVGRECFGEVPVAAASRFLIAACGYAWIGQLPYIGHDIRDCLTVQHLVTTESRHLAEPRFGMVRIDTDPPGLGNRLRIAPPQPGTGYEVGVARAAARVDAVAHAAVIAAERLAGLAHAPHAIFISLHFTEVRFLVSVYPFPPPRP